MTSTMAFPSTSLFRTGKSFAVVHFDECGKGLIAFLPEGAEVRVVGPSRIPKCVEIVYQSRSYNIFEVDLFGPCAMPVDCSRTVRAGRVKPVRALAVAAVCA